MLESNERLARLISESSIITLISLELAYQSVVRLVIGILLIINIGYIRQLLSIIVGVIK